MTRALDRHNQNTARVIPIILRPCDWHSDTFGKLQALPKDAKPVIQWDNQDEAFTNIAQGIRTAVTELQQRKNAHSNPSQNSLRTILPTTSQSTTTFAEPTSATGQKTNTAPNKQPKSHPNPAPSQPPETPQ